MDKYTRRYRATLTLWYSTSQYSQQACLGWYSAYYYDKPSAQQIHADAVACVSPGDAYLHSNNITGAWVNVDGSCQWDSPC